MLYPPVRWRGLASLEFMFIVAELELAPSRLRLEHLTDLQPRPRALTLRDALVQDRGIREP